MSSTPIVVLRIDFHRDRPPVHASVWNCKGWAFIVRACFQIWTGWVSTSTSFVVYALMNGEPVTIAPFDLIAKRVVVKGFFLNHPDVELKIPSALRETAPLVASGLIRVPIAATYRLTAFREAVAHVQRGGKVMFDVDGAI